MGQTLRQLRDKDYALKALNEDLDKARNYDGEDEEMKAFKQRLLGMNDARLQYLINATLSADNDSDIDYGNLERDQLMSSFRRHDDGLSQLLGPEGILTDLQRTLYNNAEKKAEEMQSAVQEMKETAQQKLDADADLMKQQAENTQKIADSLDDYAELAKKFGVNMESSKKPVSQEGQETMQQTAPEMAQANPAPATPEAAGTTNPAPAPDMGGQPPAPAAGPEMAPPAPAPAPDAAPMPDMGGQPPSPDMSQPPAADNGMFTPSPGMVAAVQSPYGA